MKNSSVMLAATLALGLASGAHAQSTFPDVPDNHWAAAAVKRLAELGIVEGFPAMPKTPAVKTSIAKAPNVKTQNTKAPNVKAPNVKFSTPKMKGSVAKTPAKTVAKAKTVGRAN